MKRHQETPTENHDKSVRVRSLDERIAMKNKKPWAMTTMISGTIKAYESTVSAELTDKEQLKLNQAAATQLSYEERLQRKLAEDGEIRKKRTDDMCLDLNGAESENSQPRPNNSSGVSPTGREARKMSFKDRNRRLHSLIRHFEEDINDDGLNSETDMSCSMKTSHPDGAESCPNLPKLLSTAHRPTKLGQTIDDDAMKQREKSLRGGADASNNSCPALDEFEERLRRKMAANEEKHDDAIKQREKSLTKSVDASNSCPALDAFEERLRRKMAAYEEKQK
jgi:hypothetical protein